MSSVIQRRLPQARDIKPLLRVQPFEWNPTRRRLRGAATIADLRLLAQRRTPKAAFDYADGAADQELSLARARRAFRELEFRPRVLRDVSTVDTGVEVMGQRFALPFGIGPIGFTRMLHAAGERAGATAAARAGIPFSLSTMGTTSIEDVAAAAAGGTCWFQLYMWRDRGRSMALVQRAREAGYTTLLVTVDVPVSGARVRDVHNGLTVPPALTARTLANIVRHPAWWFDLLTTEPLAFASLDRWPGTVAELLDRMFDPTVGVADLGWLREQWPGRIVVKGVQTVKDARLIADAGVDGIVLSNHGGRQLDRAPVPFRLLPTVRDALGDRIAILVDTGIMSGADIVACLALGADFALVGRAYVFGLMAGGLAGAERAIELLAEQARRTMCLLGAPTIAELGPELVALGSN